MVNFLVNNYTKISGHKVRHSDVIKNKTDKIKIDNFHNRFNVGIDKIKFLELCEYLVRGLRDRYSGNTRENGNKKLVLSLFNDMRVGKIEITIDMVLKKLKGLSDNFTVEDAKTLIALCTHRHTSFSALESYPRTLNNVFKKLNIKTNQKGLLYSIKRLLSQIYCYIYLKYKSFNRDLSNCNLSWMNLAKAVKPPSFSYHRKLSYINFSRSDLRNVNLYFTDLRLANLSYANLRETYFHYNIFYKANLSYANLQFANLNYADLRLANLSYANLRGINLKDVRIRGTNFINSIFDENTMISLKFSDNLDLEFNHINNESGSILTAINTIDDRYVDLKNNLMSQVFTYLKDKDISSIHNALSDIIFNSNCDYTAAFSDNQEFSENYFAYAFEKGNLQSVKFSTKETLLYLNYIDKLSDDKFKEFVIKNNGVFNQLIFQLRSNEEFKDDDSIKTITNKLSSKYIVLINKSMKDAIYNTYYDDKWADNGLVFTSIKDESIQYLYVGNEYVNKFLYKKSNQENNTVNWDHVLWMKDNQIQALNSLDFDELFDIFRVFQANYLFEQPNATFTKLIKLLCLGDYEQSFFQAINKKYMDVKYVDAKSQNNLKNIFNKFFKPIVGDTYNNQCSYIECLSFEERKNNITKLELKDEHINDILNAYNFESKSEIEQAELLLILSGIFAKYSSSSFFGTENDSPIALRYYAYGLMKKAYSLYSYICSNNLFNYWENEFVKINMNAFTCTSALSYNIIEYCETFYNYSTNYLGIIPLAWLR